MLHLATFGFHSTAKRNTVDAMVNVLYFTDDDGVQFSCRAGQIIRILSFVYSQCANVATSSQSCHGNSHVLKNRFDTLNQRFYCIICLDSIFTYT